MSSESVKHNVTWSVKLNYCGTLFLRFGETADVVSIIFNISVNDIKSTNRLQENQLVVNVYVMNLLNIT